MRTAIRSIVLFVFVLFSASQASAVVRSLGGANGQDVVPGQQLSFTVDMNTESTTGITLLSTGLIFDDTRLSYNQGASTTMSYILYGGKGGGGYMNASATCGGGYGSPTAGSGCSLRVNTTNQVNVDFVSVDLTNGTQNTGAPWLATLVFDVLPVPGFADLYLSLTSPGNVIGQPGGGTTTATLLGAGYVNVIPEPTTALLVGLGLAGLSLNGRSRA